MPRGSLQQPQGRLLSRLRLAKRRNVRRFAAGEAPEQEHTQRYQRGEADAALLHEDAIQSFLDELATVAKVSAQPRLP